MMNSEKTLFDTPWSDGKEVLVASLADIGLSKRLVTSMRNEGVVLVGALVQKSPYDILRKQGLGVKSLKEAQKRLKELDLSFDMNLHGWDDDLAQKARQELGRKLPKLIFEKYGGTWPKHNSLEDELKALLLEVEDQRNSEMLCLLFGFNELGPKTLESVGEPYGLTRERVRQIADRAQIKLRAIWRPTSNLFRAWDILKKNTKSVFTVEQFSTDLIRAQVTAGPFHIGGVLKALEIIGEVHVIEHCVVDGVEIYGSDSNILLLGKLFRLLRKETSSSGCTNIQRLALMVGKEFDEADTIRFLMIFFPEVLWLDDDKNWLLSKRTSRNRLENVARRVLSIAPRVELNELRSALLRPTRVEFVPPSDVLSRFLEYTGIADTDGGYAIARPDVESTQLGINDMGMALAFQHLGSPLTRKQLEDYCLDELGMNASSFYVYLSYSPVVVKLAQGVFGLVGEDVEVGRIEALREEIHDSHFETTYGWSRVGTLWCHFLADRPLVVGGSRALPTFVQNMTSGEWSVFIAGGLRTGKAKVDNGFVSGIRNALLSLGASNGDFVQLDFKIDSRELLVRIVGNEPKELENEVSLDEFDEDQED